MMFCLRRFISKPNVLNMARTYVQFAKTDPGIRRRKRILNSSEELEETELDDLEADFMNVHKTHREHVHEVEHMLEKEKFYIVKGKYFKEKLPNFLTWNDKEQIKYLHSTNPEEWTLDRLSEGFPALPDVIKKIVKSKWRKNESKVVNHDAMVQRNWEAFKKGELSDLPEKLANHLIKFTNRSLNLKPFEIPGNKRAIKVTNKNIWPEFSDIITSYEKLKNKDRPQEASEESQVNISTRFVQNAGDKDTYLLAERKAFKEKAPVTLQQLQSTIETKAGRGRVLTEDDKLLLRNCKESSANVELVEVNKEEILDIAKNKYETSTGVALATKTERDYSHLIYPEKITIPGKQRKKGYTYKLNDCYYDYDGEFLYRVPGMG